MKYIIDLAVYRISEEAYYAEKESHFQRRLATDPNLRRNLSDSLNSISELRQDHDRSYGGVWRYNEIVAYLRIHFVGTQIRAEYWVGHGNRVVRSRRKVFRLSGWKLIPESDVPSSASSDEIYGLILRHVEDCRKHLKGRYVDIVPLETLGVYVDWTKLMLRS